MPPTSLPVFDRRSVDNSVLSTLCRCPRLTFYNYRLCRAGTKVNYPIQFGDRYHVFRDILEKVYIETVLNQERDFTDELSSQLYKLSEARALDGFNDPPLEHRRSYLDTSRLIETMRAAHDGWEDEKRRNVYTVVSTETPFEVELPSGRPFAGKIDQILEWNNRLWIRDFKTTSYKPNTDSETYNPDHQMTGYVWAAQQLSGRKIAGVIVDTVYNIKTKGPIFKPVLASRNSADISHWLDWVEDQYDEWVRRCEEERWPMRTTACGDYGGCFFREPCNSGDWSTIERWLKANTVESHWDPLHPEEEVGLPE